MISLTMSSCKPQCARLTRCRSKSAIFTCNASRPCWRCADAAIPDVADVAQLALTGLAQQPAAYPGRAVHPAKIRALRD